MIQRRPFPWATSATIISRETATRHRWAAPPNTLAGAGPNTRTLMQIRVGLRYPGCHANLRAREPSQPASKVGIPHGRAAGAALPRSLRPSTPGPLPLDSALLPKGTKVRDLTLNEDFDDYGRLMQRIGDAHQPSFKIRAGSWGLNYMDPATETPKAGDVEVWRIHNLTGDTHPMHFHLVNVQVIQRQAFIGDPAAGINPVGPPGVPTPTRWAGRKRYAPIRG